MVMRYKSGIRFLSTAATKGNGREGGSESNSWMRQFLIGVGQRRHVVGTKIANKWDAVFGLVRPAEVTPLSEDEAVQAAKTCLWRGLFYAGVAAFLNEQRKAYVYVRESAKLRKSREFEAEFLARQSALGLTGVMPKSSENLLSGQDSSMQKIEAKGRQK